MPLAHVAILIYIDGIFIKNKIAVKPIYIMPSLKKKALLVSRMLGAPRAVAGCIMHELNT